MLAFLVRPFLALLLLLPAFYVLERLLGHARRTAWRTDLSWWFFTPFVGKPLVQGITFLAVAPLVLMLGLPRGEALLEGHGPLATLPWLLQFGLALFLVDGVNYAMHRAHHTSPLWRTHAVHHSSEHLDWLASVRVHPLNTAMQRLPGVFIMVLLGFDLTSIAAVVPVLGLYGLFVHVDVRFRGGPLRFLLVTPSFHRWHHASEGVPEGGCNFAGLFPIWDLAFGTYHLPAEAPEVFGVTGARPRESFWAQLAFPLRRHTTVDGAGSMEAAQP